MYHTTFKINVDDQIPKKSFVQYKGGHLYLFMLKCIKDNSLY